MSLLHGGSSFCYQLLLCSAGFVFDCGADNEIVAKVVHIASFSFVGEYSVSDPDGYRESWVAVPILLYVGFSNLSNVDLRTP